MHYCLAVRKKLETTLLGIYISTLLQAILKNITQYNIHTISTARNTYALTKLLLTNDAI